MIRTYQLSPQADKDLEEIFDFTNEKFGWNKANEYLNEFDELFVEIGKHPEIGRVRSEIKIGLYSFPKESHVIFYRIIQMKVRIIRVLHGSRDLPRLFS